MKTKIDKRKKIFSAFLIISLTSILLLSFTSGNNDEFPQDFPHDYKIVTPYIPSEIDFCGEKTPLNNIDVRERLEREIIVNTYRHSSTIVYLKRASRYFPIIEPILEEHGVPLDMKYLCVAESGLENAISSAGAIGFWQFMKPAARKYGLEVSKEVDERYNLKKATVAACKYLKDSYKKYGTWTLAAASYNMGTNGVTNQLERQKAETYYDLLLNTETSRYIFSILAMKTVFDAPEMYGFALDDDDLYPPLETNVVKIQTDVEHFADFAKKYDINYRILKLFNPWLRQNYLTNKNNKTYEIEIPTRETRKMFGL